MTETSRKNREKTPSRVKNTLASFLSITIYWKNKIHNKTLFSKNKSHLKLKHKSVSQGRGSLEGTGRPSQLRAGSPP